MSSVASVTPASDPRALWRGIDDARRPSRVQLAEPPILPPAVILPRTAGWLNPEPAASQPTQAPPPSALLQLA